MTTTHQPSAATSVTALKIAEFLGLTERRVQQLADEGVIKRGVNRGQYLFLPSVKAYIEYLQGLAAGKAVSDEGKEKQAAQIGLLQAQRDSAQLNLDVKRGALVPVEQVRSLVVTVVRVLSEGADGLADLLERKAGLTGDALVQVGVVTDQWRMRLYQNVSQALGGDVIADAPLPTAPRKKPTKKQIKQAMQRATLHSAGDDVHASAQVNQESNGIVLQDPDLIVPKKRKLGRPRLVQKDVFTPDLI